jgi:predicted transcriptional regulator
MKVVGEAEVEDVLVDNPEVIWKKTKTKSGIDKKFFDQYYKNRNQAVAYKLKNVIKYGKPKELKDYGVNSAPQSFQYVEEA